MVETGDGQEAVDLTCRLLPDVVVMDAEMPRLSGIEATKQISEKCPSTEVLMLTDRDDTLHVLDIIRSGASGYLVKSSSAEVIIHYIRKIAAGDHAFPLTTLKDISTSALTQNTQINFSRIEDLTSKELLILKLIARGLSNKEIAQRLNFSVNYIKASLSTIFIKLGVSSRTEAIAMGLKTKILTLEDLTRNHILINEEETLHRER